MSRILSLSPQKLLNFSWKCQHKIHEQPRLCAESCPAVLLWHDSRIVSQASQHAKYSSRSTMLTHFIASSGTSLLFSVLHCGVCIILYLHALEYSPPVYNPQEPLLVLTRSLVSSSISAVFIFNKYITEVHLQCTEIQLKQCFLLGSLQTIFHLVSVKAVHEGNCGLLGGR